MRILFFTHYYPPEVNAPAARTSEHCRAWAKAGHEVTIVTCAPNHPKGVVFPGYRNALYQVEAMDGVRVVRLLTVLAANEGFLRRIINYVSYLIASILALPLLPRADVIVSTSPQFFCGLAGLFARLVKRAPWVLEIRDIWPESIVTVGAMRKGLAIRFLEWLEAYAYRSADAVVSVTKSFVPHITERRGTEQGIAIFRNGADLTMFKKSDASRQVKRTLGLEGKFVAAYVGTHGMAHGLGVILDAAEKLRDDPRIAFLMVGDGSEREHLQAHRAARKLDNVHILGLRPKSDMPGIWAATDASLILLTRSDLFKKVLPSKLAESMAMECPVILGVEGEAAETLAEAKAGIAITPENADELVAAIRKLADDPALAVSYGRAGRAFVRAQFDRADIAARYLAFLEDVAAGRAAAPERGRETA